MIEFENFLKISLNIHFLELSEEFPMVENNFESSKVNGELSVFVQLRFYCIYLFIDLQVRRSPRAVKVVMAQRNRIIITLCRNMAI